MKYYLFAFVLGIFVLCAQAQINHTVAFQIDKLAVENQLQDDGNVYATLLYENCLPSDTVGAPALPYRILRFIVPNGPTSFSITTNTSEGERIDLSAPLLSIQEGTPTSAVNWPKTGFVASSLATSKAYPEKIVQIVDEGYLDGDKRILTVKVTPVQYVALSNQLLFHSSIDFTINYNTKISRSVVKTMLPITSSRIVEEADLVKMLDFVENKSDISSIVTSRQQTRTAVPRMNLPSYEYMVITADSLAPYFMRLIDWKRQKGLNAGIVTIQDILNDTSITKDEVSNLSDDAGRLRQYLRLAYQNGTKYVFLGGGRDVLPIRYGTGRFLNNEQIPTDWYFSDFNGNWNKNGNVLLGEEFGDNIDYYPELYVGRLLCRDGQEIANYIDKLLVYEQNPGLGDFSYLKRALYMESDQMQQEKEGEAVALEFIDVLSDTTIIRELPNYKSENTIYPTGKDVIDAMNGKFHGFISWFGHGSPSGVKAKSNGINFSGHYLVVAREGVYPATWNVQEVGNGLDNLINYNYPAKLYSISCSATPYDTFIDGGVVYDMKYNLGESFTVGGKYGGVAFLGNTREGWQIISSKLEQCFVNRIKLLNYKIGEAEAFSKLDYSFKSIYSHWLTLTHNLIGCPEFEMWTDIPSRFQNVSISKSSNEVTVNTSTENTNIAIKGLFNDQRVFLQVSETASFHNVPNNYIITLYKHNYLPYFSPVYLQNEFVTGTHHIKSSKITTGNFVDSSRNAGDFIVKSGSKLVLEASESVTLDAGTSVEIGASLEVKLNR